MLKACCPHESLKDYTLEDFVFLFQKGWGKGRTLVLGRMWGIQSAALYHWLLRRDGDLPTAVSMTLGVVPVWWGGGQMG